MVSDPEIGRPTRWRRFQIGGDNRQNLSHPALFQSPNDRNPCETTATGHSGIHEPGQTIVGKRIPVDCLDGFSGSRS